MKELVLIGQRFGKLTVLRPADNIGDKTAWLRRRPQIRANNNLTLTPPRHHHRRGLGCQKSNKESVSCKTANGGIHVAE